MRGVGVDREKWVGGTDERGRGMRGGRGEFLLFSVLKSVCEIRLFKVSIRWCRGSSPHNGKASPTAVSAGSYYSGFLSCFKQFHHAPLPPSHFCTWYAMQHWQFVRVWIPIMELLKLFFLPVACKFLLRHTLKSTESHLNGVGVFILFASVVVVINLFSMTDALHVNK